MIDDDAEYEARRQIRAQADADVAAFISSLDQDEGTGVPPPVKITVSEVSTKPVQFDPFAFGHEESGTAPSAGSTPTPTCECPRDVTEISGFTMSGDARYVNVGLGIDQSCSYTETWTRINQADSFSAPHQFKLYTTEACEIVYEDNREHDLFVECFDGTFTTHASIVWTANLAGVINTPPQVTFGFFAQGDNLFSDCTATYADVVIPLDDNCDLSVLLGDRTVSNNCGPDGDGGTWEVNGQISIF